MSPTSHRLNELLIQADSEVIDESTADKFASYMALLLRWNAKTNLTSIRDEEGIRSRHFVESILCAQNIPKNITSLLDFGSGAGFPGLPIALIRKEISVTLAESQNKKAAFLREAVRTLCLTTQVHAGRAQDLPQTYDCVTLRAVDNMDQAIPAAVKLISPEGWLSVMTTVEESSSIQALANQFTSDINPFFWSAPISLPKNTNRILILGQRKSDL